ncbi:MAG: CBS domain-containing protein [Thermoplasmata archaeon]|nr:CBS domain-containing protein [Thermoplasmata archaeon]
MPWKHHEAPTKISARLGLRGGTMDAVAEIRKRRLSLGIPLGELARAVGRSDATLSRIERGQIRPSYDLVQRILGYLEEQEGVAAPTLRAADLMKRGVITVDGNTPISAASQLMERGGFSQLPVLDGGRVTGAISESALLKALAQPSRARSHVHDIQEGAYPQVDEACPAELLTGLLSRYPAVLVVHRGQLIGIITKTDLIRGLRGTSLRRSPGSGSSNS